SPERAWSWAFLGSSAGGPASLGQAAANTAVMTPILPVLCIWAAALLAYSVTRDSSDTSLVRCQPRIVAVFLASTTTTVYFGKPVFGFFTSLKVNKFRPSIVSVTAAAWSALLIRRTP